MLPLDSPVLSLAVDAVSKLDGQSALCGLITLFSKCKDGLQDGPRLENMAWRLWSVERFATSTTSTLSSSCPDELASPVSSSSSSSHSPDDTEYSSDGDWGHDQATAVHDDDPSRSYRSNSHLASASPTRSQLSASSHFRQSPNATLNHRKSSISSESHTPSKPNLYRRPSISSRRTHSSTSVGKIMADLLPEKLDVLYVKKVSSPTSEQHHSWRESASTLQITPDLVPPNAPDVILQPAGLSQGHDDDDAAEHMQPQPSTRFPTVVIESPTPHPTPPLTPQSSPQPTSPQADTQQQARRDSLVVPQRSSFNPSSTSRSSRGETSAEAISSNNASAATLSQSDEMSSGVITSDSSDAPKSPEVLNGAEISTLNPFVLQPNQHRSAESTLPSNVNGNTSAMSFVNANAVAELEQDREQEQALQQQQRKFFIAQHGSPDGDSPDTSASSQVGSHCASGSTSASVLAQKGGEPASLASRISRTSDSKSHSSYGSSSGGLRFRRKAKGKGKEVRWTMKSSLQAQSSGQVPVQRIASTSRLAQQQQQQQLQQMQNGHVNGKGKQVASVVEESKADCGQVSRLASTVNHRSQPELSRRTAGPSAVTVGGLPSPLEPGRDVHTNMSQSRAATQATAVIQQQQQPPPAAPPSGTSATNRGRIEIVSSEYDSEDDSWESEDYSVEDVDGGNENDENTEGRRVSLVSSSTKAETNKLAEAAAEAKRQLNLFEKIPRRSYSNLNRSQSGLLSSIFHPDPERFPPDHPYRLTRSSQDILAHLRGPRGLYSPTPTNMQSSGLAKSSVAGPVAATVTAQGVGSPNKSRRSPLRLKAGPPDAEMEESDTDADDDNKLQISASAAEQKLAALHKANRPQNRVQPLTQQSQVQQQLEQQQQQHQHQHQQVLLSQQQQQEQRLPQVGTSHLRSHFSQQQLYHPAQAALPQLTSVATAPMNLGYPYDLSPTPALPSTPRTIRRKMLSEELSESLRRNLLWERQVSKQRPLGQLRRIATANTTTNGISGGFRSAGNGLVTVNGISGSGSQGASSTAAAAAGGGVGTRGAVNNNDVSLEERKRQAIARNRSFEGYHVAGW